MKDLQMSYHLQEKDRISVLNSHLGKQASPTAQEIIDSENDVKKSLSHFPCAFHWFLIG